MKRTSNIQATKWKICNKSTNVYDLWVKGRGSRIKCRGSIKKEKKNENCKKIKCRGSTEETLRLDMDKFQAFLTRCFCILSRFICTISPATANKQMPADRGQGCVYVEFCVWLHGGWKPRNCEIQGLKRKQHFDQGIAQSRFPQSQPCPLSVGIYLFAVAGETV